MRKWRVLSCKLAVAALSALASANASAFDTVKEAVEKALEMATPDSLIYIGGSTFVVADALPLFA